MQQRLAALLLAASLLAALPLAALLLLGAARRLVAPQGQQGQQPLAALPLAALLLAAGEGLARAAPAAEHAHPCGSHKRFPGDPSSCFPWERF